MTVAVTMFILLIDQKALNAQPQILELHVEPFQMIPSSVFFLKFTHTCKTQVVFVTIYAFNYQ